MGRDRPRYCAGLNERRTGVETEMFKVLGWTVGIIFLIGLLVVTGVLKLIF